MYITGSYLQYTIEYIEDRVATQLRRYCYYKNYSFSQETVGQPVMTWTYQKNNVSKITTLRLFKDSWFTYISIQNGWRNNKLLKENLCKLLNAFEKKSLDFYYTIRRLLNSRSNIFMRLLINYCKRANKLLHCSYDISSLMELWNYLTFSTGFFNQIF